MWHLAMAESGGSWVTVGSFENVTAAARKIIEIENYPVTGVVFEILIGTEAYENEDEAFSHLEHTATRSNRCYVVKRIKH
jgi:hypothetical protein